MILPPPRVAQMRVGGLTAEQGAGEVCIEHQVPIFRGEILRLLAHGGAGIVDEDVEMAEAPDGRLHRGVARRFFQHVEFDEFGARAGGAQFGERGGGFRLVASGNRNRGAGGGKALRHSEADAAIAAGDQARLFPSESNNAATACSPNCARRLSRRPAIVKSRVSRRLLDALGQTLVARERGEARHRALELQLDGAGRAVALLADDDFGLAVRPSRPRPCHSANFSRSDSSGLRILW